MAKPTTAEIQNEIKSLTDWISGITNNLEECKVKVEKIEVVNPYLQKKVESLETNFEKYNVVIYGMNCNEQNILAEILDTFNIKLEVSVNRRGIRDSYFVGKLVQSKPRPLVVEFVTNNLKKTIPGNWKEEVESPYRPILQLPSTNGKKILCTD